MITRAFFLFYLFIFISTPSICQKKIKILFNPDVNKEYIFKTKSQIKINNENMLNHNIMKTVFSKEKNTYRNKSNLEVFEVFNNNELIFSLQKKLNGDSNRRQIMLMHFLENEEFKVLYDNKGNIIEKWNTNSIQNKELAQIIENFNQNIDPFYLNKEFILGEEFKIENTNSTTQQIQNLTGKLIIIKDNKAVFKFNSEFYTAVRDRKRNIIGKEKNKFEGIISVNLNSGIPYQYKFIFKNNTTSIITSTALDSETFTEPSIYNEISYFHKNKEENKSYLNPILIGEDSLRRALRKNYFKTKEDAIDKMKNINFLSVNKSRSGQYRKCYSVIANLNLPKGIKNINAFLKSIKIYNHQNELISTQKLDYSPINLMKYREEEEIPLPISKYCDLEINYIEVTLTLEASYGDLNNIKITSENKNQFGVNQLKPNEIEVSNFYPFYFFKDKNNKLASITKNKLKPFSEATIKKYNLKDLTVNDIFLYCNIFEKYRKGFNTLYFKDDIISISKIEINKKETLDRTIKIKPLE